MVFTPFTLFTFILEKRERANSVNTMSRMNGVNTRGGVNSINGVSRVNTSCTAPMLRWPGWYARPREQRERCEHLVRHADAAAIRVTARVDDVVPRPPSR